MMPPTQPRVLERDARKKRGSRSRLDNRSELYARSLSREIGKIVAREWAEPGPGIVLGRFVVTCGLGKHNPQHVASAAADDARRVAAAGGNECELVLAHCLVVDLERAVEHVQKLVGFARMSTDGVVG